MAKSINQTTIDALRLELAAGFELGESIQQITRRISGYFSEPWRAEMIARTETIAASNEGALRRYERDNVQKTEFYPSPDACLACLDLAGEYPTKEAHGMIPVHPRCRCKFLPVVTLD